MFFLKNKFLKTINKLSLKRKIVCAVLAVTIFFVGYFLLGNFFVSKVNFNRENGKNAIEEQKVLFQKPKRNKVKLSKEQLRCPGCNIVIISLTNTRKDHLGIYGYKRDTSPNINNFFKDSLIFENTFASSSWTLPASASFFTSLFPQAHRVMDRRDKNRLNENVNTFTEILKKEGYSTAGFTGGGDYNSKFNVAQGFDVYVDEGAYVDYGIEYNQPNQSLPVAYLGAQKLIPSAERWLEENKKDKKFLFLQGYDTHCPFTPKSPYNNKFDSSYDGNIDFSTCFWTTGQTSPVTENGQKYWLLKNRYSGKELSEVKLTDRDVSRMIALYDSEIAQADEALGYFFKNIKNLNLEKNTIFVFMAEHGDLLGEHGRFMRAGSLKGTFYEPVLNFPLLIKHPNIKESIEIDSLTQTVDIMPTLLEILGAEDPQQDIRQGKSLVPELAGEGTVNEYAYAFSEFNATNNLLFSGSSRVKAVRTKEWKLIHDELYNNEGGDKKDFFELYKIADDPLEQGNILSKENIIFQKLRTKLDEWYNAFLVK